MLKLEYVPQYKIRGLSTDKKIKRLMDSVRENKIVLLEGRLNPLEETEFIKETMEKINKSFKGVEIATIDYRRRRGEIISNIKANLAKFLLGTEGGITIIGPATIVKEIKKNPDKIELLMKTKK